MLRLGEGEGEVIYLYVMERLFIISLKIIGVMTNVSAVKSLYNPNFLIQTKCSSEINQIDLCIAGTVLVFKKSV